MFLIGIFFSLMINICEDSFLNIFNIIILCFIFLMCIYINFRKCKYVEGKCFELISSR
jgi:hypothetical protein